MSETAASPQVENLINNLCSFLQQRDTYLARNGERQADVMIRRRVTEDVEAHIVERGVSIGFIKGSYTRSERATIRLRARQKLISDLGQQVFAFVEPLMKKPASNLAALRSEIAQVFDRCWCEALHNFSAQCGWNVNKAVHLCWSNSKCETLTDGKRLDGSGSAALPLRGS